ncbi:MAG TPA: hypothetical protein VLQ78_08335 [Ornithinibacter sp.]|nr:hypothetical protein [Ornithinibacter sp.]
MSLTPLVDLRSADPSGHAALARAGSPGSAVDVSVAAGALVISNEAAVSVGHKPGSTSAGDAYDGLLDDLVITRG